MLRLERNIRDCQETIYCRRAMIWAWHWVRGRIHNRLRKFHKMIFMGNGYEPLGKCYKLIQRLQEGINNLCGAQQGPRIKEMDDDLIYDVVRDVAMALTGKEIEFVDGTEETSK